MKWRTTFVVAVLGAILGPAQASLVTDAPIVGGTMVVATQGTVEISYLGSDAAYFSTLYLGSTPLFNKATNIGATIDLGSFAAGTTLTFSLAVSNSGDVFFTGDGSLNPDGLAHARATTQLNGIGVYVTNVGFEDLLGGGDRDYNDFMFRLTNVYDPPAAGPLGPAPPGVPEPATLALLGIALAGLGFSRRKQ